MEEGSIERLISSLKEHKEKLQKEILKLNLIQDDIDWYIRYYKHVENDTLMHIPFKVKEEERWILTEPINKNEEIYGTAGYRLTKKKNSKKYLKLNYLRQNGYILDYNDLVKGKISPTHYFIYLREKPDFECDDIMTIPKGEYICVRSRILSEDFRNEYIKDIFKLSKKPPFVLANEYEDNFDSFKHCVYEIQIEIK